MRHHSQTRSRRRGDQALARRHRVTPEATPLTVRELCVTVGRPGHRPTTLRLWTSLTDPQAAPVLDLARLYAQRWEHGLYFRELKRHLRRTDLLQNQRSTPQPRRSRRSSLPVPARRRTGARGRWAAARRSRSCRTRGGAPPGPWASPAWTWTPWTAWTFVDSVDCVDFRRLRGLRGLSSTPWTAWTFVDCVDCVDFRRLRGLRGLSSTPWTAWTFVDCVDCVDFRRLRGLRGLSSTAWTSWTSSTYSLALASASSSTSARRRSSAMWPSSRWWKSSTPGSRSARTFSPARVILVVT